MLDGDFPDGDRDITETLNAIRPASWDGTTITFGGASAVGLPPDQVYRQAGPARRAPAGQRARPPLP